jgi:hypothetical protein
MDKFTVALVSLLIFVLLVIGAVLLSGQTPLSPQGNEDGNVTEAAIRTALADPGVREAASNSFGKTCAVANVSAYGADGRSGLVGTNETLLKVSLTFGSDWATGENGGIIVDMANSTVVGREQYFRRLGMPPYSESILVPPGASWYRRINGIYFQGEGLTELFATITIEPADAKVYATVVDNRSLLQFLNGAVYAPLQFIDPNTGFSSTCENRLITTPWLVNMSVPDPRFHGQILLDGPYGSYYVILKNEDPSRSVEMSYDMRL